MKALEGAEVTVVRIYLHERGKGVRELLRYLHDESGVRGVTVFRGVLGYGEDHKERGASLTALSLDLPMVVEFFDVPERAAAIVEHLESIVKPEQVVWWSARVGALGGEG